MCRYCSVTPFSAQTDSEAGAEAGAEAGFEAGAVCISEFLVYSLSGK